MIKWLDKVFRYSQPGESGGNCDASDFDATLEAARSLSMHPSNRDGIVVIVELGSLFDHKTCTYIRQQYNFYTYRGNGDFHEISNLKAAVQNGRRVDRIDKANAGRIILHDAPVPTEAPVSAADDKPAFERLMLPMPSWFTGVVEPAALAGDTPVDPDEMARLFVHELAEAANEMAEDVDRADVDVFADEGLRIPELVS
ncbi:MAG: hypothetical protein ACLQVD_18600 [Capsulimonadaceae bacterium]